MTARIKPATDKQKRSLADLVRDALHTAINRGEISSTQAQEIIKRGGDFKRSLVPELLSVLWRFAIPPNIVVVPADLSAVELTAALKRERDLTYVDPDQTVWDFYADREGNPIPGRGKKYEMVVWKPDLKQGEAISSETVRQHFRDLDAHGNVGAFTEWLRRVEDPTGYYASIPEDNQCWRSPSGSLCAPYSIFDGGNRKLRQNWLGHDWSGRWSFVAFREIP